MYTLITTFARSYSPRIGVREFDASQLLIRDVLNNNAQIVFVVTHPLIEGERLLDPKLVEADIFSKSYNLTVNAWLISLGNQTLPLQNAKVSLTTNRAFAKDGYASGFDIQLSTGSLGGDSGGTLDIDKDDLSLSKSGINYRDMHSHVLAVVAGHLHLTDASDDGFYVIDGGITARLSGSNQVGLISLSKVSSFTAIPMRQCHVEPTNPGGQLRDGFFINTPTSLANKTVWLSLCGYLFYLQDQFKVTNDRVIFIDWSKLRMVPRFLQSKSMIDLVSINTLMDNDGDYIDEEVFNSDSVIHGFLDLSQSFVIILDNPTIEVDPLRIEDANLPGKYYTYHNAHDPIQSSNGLLPAITLIDESKAWVVSSSVSDGQVDHFLNDYNHPDQSIETDTLVPPKPHKNAGFYALGITTTHIDIE